LKKMIVRAAIKDDEVRGMTILWDPATENLMDYVAFAMSGVFTPFPTMAVSAGGAPSRPKVEYGTGIVVSAAGHVLTDRQLLDGCNVILVGSFGNAERQADDKDTDLALVRLHGAGKLAPAVLANDGAGGSYLTLVGIADPQSQGGAGAISIAAAKLNGD